MPRQRPDVVDLEWDQGNFDHVANHIDPLLIQEMIFGGDWVALPNREGHPPAHVMIVGRAPGGRFVTAILRSVSVSAGLWRPITGWMSSDSEMKRYLSDKRKKGSRRG